MKLSKIVNILKNNLKRYKEQTTLNNMIEFIIYEGYQNEFKRITCYGFDIFHKLLYMTKDCNTFHGIRSWMRLISEEESKVLQNVLNLRAFTPNEKIYIDQLLSGFEAKYNGCTGYKYSYCDPKGCGCTHCLEAYYAGHDDYCEYLADGTPNWIVNMGNHDED